jgi:hypothetical protein
MDTSWKGIDSLERKSTSEMKRKLSYEWDWLDTETWAIALSR